MTEGLSRIVAFAQGRAVLIVLALTYGALLTVMLTGGSHDDI